MFADWSQQYSFMAYVHISYLQMCDKAHNRISIILHKLQHKSKCKMQMQYSLFLYLLSPERSKWISSRVADNAPRQTEAVCHEMLFASSYWRHKTQTLTRDVWWWWGPYHECYVSTAAVQPVCQFPVCVSEYVKCMRTIRCFRAFCIIRAIRARMHPASVWVMTTEQHALASREGTKFHWRRRFCVFRFWCFPCTI